jgi:serine/threonine-protein kinase
MASAALRQRQKLGQYRIIRKLGGGGFSAVYQAYDTIEGSQVALKIPHADLISRQTLDLFRNEVRLTARLDHPNILPIKYAGFIDGRFVIVYPLGKGSLEDRLRNRLSVRNAVGFGEQMLEAVACAHRHRIMHLDIKPENFIIFDGNRLRLADFGLARVARYTQSGSGSGTVGYIAPEQAMGKPTFRSDVFSLGLILYRMVSGHLPEWPFDWPPPAYNKVRSALPPELINFLKRSLEVDQKRRFRRAGQMLSVFRRLRPKALTRSSLQRHYRRRRRARGRDLDVIRFKLFRQRFGKPLEVNSTCRRCNGPVSEAMQACPWCGSARRTHEGETRFPARCTRCKRGRKLDWRFCAWCFGPPLQRVANRRFSDRRYAARCSNPRCRELVLMPFMRYCPMCRTKVRRKWKLKGSEDRCPRCRWAVLRDFWNSCPWCAKPLGQR